MAPPTESYDGTLFVPGRQINDAYLVTVAKPCPGLEFARGIGVTSKQRRIVSRKFDYVTYGNGRCQIMEIQPIDYRQMLKDGPDAK